MSPKHLLNIYEAQIPLQTYVCSHVRENWSSTETINIFRILGGRNVHKQGVLGKLVEQQIQVKETRPQKRSSAPALHNDIDEWRKAMNAFPVAMYDAGYSSFN
jgi:hypothetical protein